MVILSDFLAPEVGVRHEEQQTTLYVNEREIGKGTLYITERLVPFESRHSKYINYICYECSLLDFQYYL